ncbi:MAG: phosphatidylserine decarboxylase [Gammaproteobacteria bacterium]|nr:phosphatidylserine decarboxylase [Gammaproteobacteria bacterium]
MLKKLFAYFQYILPQHLLTKLFARLGQVSTPWVKNNLIHSFVKYYQVDLNEAVIEDVTNYPTFNDFFIRHLKPTCRPINHDDSFVVSPVDGTIAQGGKIRKNQLLQAKGHSFSLEALLAHAKTAALFENGEYETFYLAPRNYHRVHMPFSGKLLSATYIPGRLFSVNKITAEIIPDLYARNERLVMLFETELGPMAIVMVGALIVGGMQTIWMNRPVKYTSIQELLIPTNLVLNKGDELGYFIVGSTVLLLFGPQTIHWDPETPRSIHFGQKIATKIISLH